MAEWQPIKTAPERVPVLTKIDDGRGARNEAVLKRAGRLWWFADGSMYVYYAPTHWMPVPPVEQSESADAVRRRDESWKLSTRVEGFSS